MDINPRSSIPSSSSTFAPFFLAAAILLICALTYSLLFLCVIRLGTISIPDHDIDNDHPNHTNANVILNGRIYFCNERIYMPLCCFLFCYRRASIWYYEDNSFFGWYDDDDDDNDDNEDSNSKFGVTREERKKALENILECMVICFEDNTGTHAHTPPLVISKNDDDDDVIDLEECKEEFNVNGEDDEDSLDENDNNVCSICLMRYEKGDLCVSSNVCSHQFHKACLLEWLEKSWNNTGCPCCRQELVNTMQIIQTAKKIKTNDNDNEEHHHPHNQNQPSNQNYLSLNNTTTTTTTNQQSDDSYFSCLPWIRSRRYRDDDELNNATTSQRNEEIDDSLNLNVSISISTPTNNADAYVVNTNIDESIVSTNDNINANSANNQIIGNDTAVTVTVTVLSDISDDSTMEQTKDNDVIDCHDVNNDEIACNSDIILSDDDDNECDSTTDVTDDLFVCNDTIVSEELNKDKFVDPEIINYRNADSTTTDISTQNKSKDPQCKDTEISTSN